jgi:hypothetical protein
LTTRRFQPRSRPCLALALGTALCGCQGAPTAPAPTESPAEGSEAIVPVGTEPRFFDVTAASGITWAHNNGAFGQRWLPETLGPGVLLFDADGDEALDVLFVNGTNFPGQPGEATTPTLYVNRGNLTFEDRTVDFGLDLGVYCLGGAAADVENDGDPDIYLSCVGQDLLLRNEGGRFVEVGAQAGLTREYELGASVAFFDADADGFLDVFAARYVPWTPETDLFCAAYGEAKSYCTPFRYPGTASRFYRNRGDGTFEERTREAGLFNSEAKALGVVAFDVEGDGRTDLAVACDTYQNLLYRNLGDGTFEEIAAPSGLAFSNSGRYQGGMGIGVGDFDRSGEASVVITYFMFEEMGVYLNQGDRFFFDVARRSGIGDSTRLTLGWATFFFDFNLDGWLDLLVVNGHLDEQVETAGREGRYAQPQQLFQNAGGGKFVDVTDTAGGDLATPLVGRGGAFGDLDGDGDPDVVVTSNGGAPKLFENRGESGNWLIVDLEGTTSNRDAVGARIEVRTAQGRQTWQVYGGGSYLSQSQREAIFGLGEAAEVDEVVVRWPSGGVQRLSDVPANQRLRIVEEEEI